MKDLLLLLTELQNADEKIANKERAIRALPEKLGPARQDLAKLEAILDVERQRVAEAEAWRSEQQMMVDQAREDVKKAKIKLQGASNSREYASANREVDNKRRMIMEREAEIKKINTALGTSKETVDTHDADIAKLREYVDAEGAGILVKLEELKTEITDSASHRTAIAEKLDANILKRYERVKQQRGTAVVGVRNGVCGGCNVTLPPQLNNTLARFDSLENCPQCRRIVYRVELLEADEADEADEAESDTV